MTINDFLDLTPEYLRGLNKKERRDLVDEMSPKANQRLNRLQTLPIKAPALSSRLDDDDNVKYFTSEDKDHYQLANELKELQWFLGAKTSTITGARKSAIRVYAKVLGEKQKNVSYNDVISAFSSDESRRKVFWSAYNKILESDPNLISTKDNKIMGALDSDKAQAKIYEEFSKNSFNLESDDLWTRARDILKKEYVPPEDDDSPMNIGSKR